MVDNLHSVWNGVGDAILSKESTLELTWLLCWEKEEEILKICSFILFFSPFGRREIGGPLKILTKQSELSNSVYV